MPIYAAPSTPPTFECLYQEADRQKIPPELLLAVMRTEGGRMGEFSKNNNGTYDIGPMQINTTWLDRLARQAGSTPQVVASKLAYHGCWNMAVGAWILRSAIDEAPGDVWRGVGYYNSHTPKYAQAYTRKVQANYIKILIASSARQERR